MCSFQALARRLVWIQLVWAAFIYEPFRLQSRKVLTLRRAHRMEASFLEIFRKVLTLRRAHHRKDNFTNCFSKALTPKRRARHKTLDFMDLRPRGVPQPAPTLAPRLQSACQAVALRRCPGWCDRLELLASLEKSWEAAMSVATAHQVRFRRLLFNQLGILCRLALAVGGRLFLLPAGLALLSASHLGAGPTSRLVHPFRQGRALGILIG